MNDAERDEALTDLLEFCRDPRRELSVGRKLGSLLLAQESPQAAAAWTSAQDYALAAQVSELIRAELASNRQLVGLEPSVMPSPALHRQALRADIDPRHGELPFWSLLWAYYICQIPIDDIAYTCGWEPQQSYALIEHGRRRCMSQKLAALDREMSAATQQSKHRPYIDARDQRITGNQGIAINGNVSGSTVEQHNLRRRQDDPA